MILKAKLFARQLAIQTSTHPETSPCRPVPFIFLPISINSSKVCGGCSGSNPKSFNKVLL